MITIHQPKILVSDGNARLTADIDIDGEIRPLWFEVAAEYAPYLCTERADGFLVGLLHWAMEHRHDIVCETPVSADLYFKLTVNLIPALAKNSTVLYPVKITAKTDAASLANAGGVGTGISCGVDSFHVLAEYMDPPEPLRHLKLTHLLIHNVGSYGAGEKGRAIYLAHVEHVKNLARDYGFTVIYGDSNMADAFPQGFLYAHSYVAALPVFALQKLWRTFFIASSGHDDLTNYSLVNSERFGTSRHELLLLPSLCTNTLSILSGGAGLLRIEKVRKIADYAPTYRYLTACGHTPHNCCTCIKCRRTMLELYAIDALERYRAVFDVDRFLANRNWYFVRYLSKYWQRDPFFVEIHPLLRKRIPWYVYLRAGLTYGPQVLYRRIVNWNKGRPKRGGTKPGVSGGTEA